MGELLSTLLGDIPGLLRRGSPVLYTAGLIPGVIVALVAEELGSYSDPPILSVALFGQHVLPDRCMDVYAHDRWHLALDLTDKTGRWHAALWAAERLPVFPMTQPERDAAAVLILDAQRGAGMSPEDIDRLARLVLRLAGRL